jgi:hypothetical protein
MKLFMDLRKLYANCTQIVPEDNLCTKMYNLSKSLNNFRSCFCLIDMNMHCCVKHLYKLGEKTFSMQA